MVRPVALTVAVIAPSGYVDDAESVARALQRLRDCGCRVVNYYDAAGISQRFAASDSARLQQLHAAAANPEVDVVLALRGGYGLSRLLPMIDFAALAASKKWFVGHSDFTALNMGLLAQEGAVSLHGPMLCPDFSREDTSPFTCDGLWACLRGPEHAIRFRSHLHASLDVSGIVWGGNLSMLNHLIGTPYMPRVEQGILFIEDINEHPYRVERMLLQMQYAGLLNQKAIVFGDFSGYRLSEYDNGYDFDVMLDYLRDRTGVPMFGGLPFGHTRDKATLVVGSQGRLQVSGAESVLTMSGYPSMGRIARG